MNDTSYMRRALALARRGAGYVLPNPMVGAVIVKDERIISQGWHHKAGEAHAERDAIANAQEVDLRGATIYVSLEPCNHKGRTPPCTAGIIDAGIARVVYAMDDPNPHVAGSGAQTLRDAGIEVTSGVLENEARALLRHWSHWVQTDSPFVAVKFAISSDGKIAWPEGDERRWISSSSSQAHVHRIRRSVAAVMVGAKTVLADNPRLSNRSGFGPQPLRVVLDSTLRSDPNSRCYGGGSLVVAGSEVSEARVQEFQSQGTEVVQQKRRRVDVEEVCAMLGSRGIQSVLCEGGAELAESIVAANLCSRFYLYRCPVIIGEAGLDLTQGRPALKTLLSSAPSLRRRIGSDVVELWELESRES